MIFKQPSDWAAPLTCLLACLLELAIAHFGTEPVPFASSYAIVLGTLSPILLFFTLRGRKLPEGSLLAIWRDAGLSGSVVIGGALLLTFGGNGLLYGLFSVAPFQEKIFPLLMSLGFLFMAWQILFALKFTVVSKGIIFLSYGKPFSFRYRKIDVKRVASWEARTDRVYAGTLGMLSTWQRVWFLYGVGTGRDQFVLQTSSQEEASSWLKELVRQTGIPAKSLPKTTGPDEIKTVTP